MKELIIATFDSGFGGYLTAHEIAKKAAILSEQFHTSIKVRHYGDTAHAPYGDKTPAQLIDFVTEGISCAIREGADRVFLACNTASVHHVEIRNRIEEAFPGRSQHIISILGVSIEAATTVINKRLQLSGDVHFVLLATPLTVKNMFFPKAIASSYEARLDAQPAISIASNCWNSKRGSLSVNISQQSSFHTKDGKKVTIHQFAPASWVWMIETGISKEEKNKAISEDTHAMISQLPPNITLDGVGYYCTHYPVFDAIIRDELRDHIHDKTSFIRQESLLADLFFQETTELLQPYKRDVAAAPVILASMIEKPTPEIFISGNNVKYTENLLNSIFPNEENISVRQINFAEALDNNNHHFTNSATFLQGMHEVNQMQLLSHL